MFVLPVKLSPASNLIIKSKDDSLEDNRIRLDEITEERNKNSEIVGRLLKKLDSE